MNLVDLLEMRTRASEAAIQPLSSGSESGARTEATLGRDDFLNMLLAQLENQDPLDPQDATEFTAQLATFSMLEQLVSIEQGIGRLEDLLENTAGLSARALPRVELAR
jgi:flagellar basal-body rod modification protein FlgD